MVRRNFTYDDATLLMKDAGLVAASAAATVASAARILDIGSGLVEGNIVIDVTALEIASNTEIYDIVLQLSSDAAFDTDTNIVEQCAINLSAAEVKRTDSNVDNAIGRYIMPFSNEFNGTRYRYARLYTIVAGDVATGINYTARMAKKNAA